MDDESKHHMFNEFLGRFIVSGAPEELLSALRDAFKAKVVSQNEPSVSRSRKKCVWLILEYHSALFKAGRSKMLPRVIRSQSFRVTVFFEPIDFGSINSAARV